MLTLRARCVEASALHATREAVRASSPYYAQENVQVKCLEQPSMSPIDTACVSVQSAPDVSWIDAFHQQVTEALFASCLRHARWCLHAYRLHDVPEDAIDLVQRALADILERRVQWDPARRSLVQQVCDVIRYRVRDLKRGAARRAHAPIIEDEDDTEGHADVLGVETVGAVREAAVARHEAEHPEHHLRSKQARELGARIGAELAVLVAEQRDDDAAAILACWVSGTSERKDILAETGMSAEAYHDARRRLLRLAGRLSNELRAKGKAQTE